MRRIIAILAATAVLAACADVVPRQMDRGLRSLVGQNIGAAAQRLGPPNQKLTNYGETTYIWSSDPAALRTQVIRNCLIKITTDEGGTIRNFVWSGDSGICTNYAGALQG